MLDSATKNTVVISQQDGSSHTFNFDKVFSTMASQGEVYEQTAQELLANLFKGYNCGLFAYGQTGAWKRDNAYAEACECVRRSVTTRAQKKRDNARDCAKVRFCAKVWRCAQCARSMWPD